MKFRPKILVIHGPNLNLLGIREKKTYGTKSLKKINADLEALAKKRGGKLVIYQSNSEGDLINKIQKYGAKVDGILINPAAYTHTSVALRDVLSATSIPKVEVHLSNIYKREPFRRHSLISDVVDGHISVFGSQSYQYGLKALLKVIQEKIS